MIAIAIASAIEIKQGGIDTTRRLEGPHARRACTARMHEWG